MTPTWKVGDVFYRFIDSIDFMRVYAFTVTKVHKLRTEVQSRTTRAVVSHQTFANEYAKTEADAVQLAIDEVERDAKFSEGVAASKRKLATSYKQFLLGGMKS